MWQSIRCQRSRKISRWFFPMNWSQQSTLGSKTTTFCSGSQWKIKPRSTAKILTEYRLWRDLQILRTLRTSLSRPQPIDIDTRRWEWQPSTTGICRNWLLNSWRNIRNGRYTIAGCLSLRAESNASRLMAYFRKVRGCECTRWRRTTAW